MTRLGVGIIGLGEVAQLMHLPVLHRLRDRFEVTALFDASPSVARKVAERWQVPGLVPSVEALVADPAVDVVFVLSPDQHHCEHATAALRAGKHVFVEKPVCLTRTDAVRLDAMARSANRLVMVGYMRRFAPAFLEAKAQLAALGPLSLCADLGLLLRGAMVLPPDQRGCPSRSRHPAGDGRREPQASRRYDAVGLR